MSKRKDILNAALKLFIDKGFDNTPTSLISKEAGVATGTLFHHFKTKEELINKLYIHLKEDIHGSLQVKIRKSDSVQDRMKYIWLEYTKWGITNPDRYRFLHLAGTSAYIEESTREQVETLYSDIFSVIDDGYKKKIFQLQPRALLMSIMVAHLNATLTHFLENPDDYKKKKIVEDAFGSFWRSLIRE